MAYNPKNQIRKRAFVMEHYWDWKDKNGDIPDTFFVRVILPKIGHPMAYVTFMTNYKHFEKKSKEVVNKKQLALF